MERVPKREVALLVVAGGCFVAMALWLQSHGGHLPRVDQVGHRWALAHRTSTTIALARWCTLGGESMVVIPVVALVGAWTGGPQLARRGRRAALLAAALCLGLLTRISVAHAVARARPPRADWAGGAGGFAFPSGHTTAATIAAGLIAWTVLRRHRDAEAGPAPTTPRRRLEAIGLAVLAAALVGGSRVWLGVHWPLDVVGAWLLGTAWLGLCALVFWSLSTGITRRETPLVVSRQ